MFRTLANAFKNKEIRRSILITLGLLFLYRLGCWIPVPGIENAAIITQNSDLFTLLSSIGGNALSNGALLAIGISPYINASIIIQLLTVAIPPLERLTKQGEDGRRKIANITRFVTLGLAIAQAVGVALSWYNTEGALKPVFGGESTAWVAVIVGTIMVAGAMFTMWLGERITEYNVGNGMSLLIFVGIISTAGQAIRDQFVIIFTQTGDAQLMAMWTLLGFLLAVLLIFLFIVWIDLAERKIPVNYARQIKGRKQYGGQSTHIPIKINANGVLPIIFATAMITFPQIIFQLIFGTNLEKLEANTGGAAFYNWWSNWMGAGKPIYFVVMGLLILFFSYFYSQIQFNPEEVARNLQQYGGTLIGIRPGKPTADYLSKVSKRLTLFGALFLMVIAIVPSVIFSIVFKDSTGLINAFTATGLLIVVSVALEIQKQLESQLMMKHYKGFLK